MVIKLLNLKKRQENTLNILKNIEELNALVKAKDEKIHELTLNLKIKYEVNFSYLLNNLMCQVNL